jgi:hypothetical protein
MNKGTVVTVMTAVGEYIGRLDRIEDGVVYVDNPRLIVKGPDGEIGFGRGVCMSAIENPPNVAFSDVIFTVVTNESFERAWIEATSGIVL